MAELPTPLAPGAFPATPQAGTESANSDSSYFPVNSAHLTASTLVGLVLGGPVGALALGGLSVAESTEAAALSDQQLPKHNAVIANELGGAPVPASLLGTASGGFREDAEPPSPFPAEIDTAVGLPAKASQLPLIRGEKNESDFDAPPLSPENTRSVPFAVVVLPKESVPESLKVDTNISLAEPVTAAVPDRSPASAYADDEKARDVAIAASGEDADFGKSAAAFGIGKSADLSQPLPPPPVLDNSDVQVVSPATPIKVDNENPVEQEKRRHREVAVLAAGAGVGAGVGAGAYGASQLADDEPKTSRDTAQAVNSDLTNDESKNSKFAEKLQGLQQPTTAAPPIAAPSSAYTAESPELSTIKGQDFDKKALPVPAHDRFAEQRAVLHSDVQHSSAGGAAAVVGGGVIGVAGAGIVAGELYEHPAGLHPATFEKDLAHLSPPTDPKDGLVGSPVEQNRSEIPPVSNARDVEDKQGSWGKATLAVLGGGAVAGGAIAHGRGKDVSRDDERLGQRDLLDSDDGSSPSRSYATPTSYAAQQPVSHAQRQYDDSLDPLHRQEDLQHSPSTAHRHAQDSANHSDSRRDAATREQQDANQDLHRRLSKLHRAHHPDQPREDNTSPRHYDDPRDVAPNRHSLVGAQHQERQPLINAADDAPTVVPTEFSPHMKIAHRPDQAGRNRLHKSSHDSPIESGPSSPAHSSGGRFDGSPRAAESWTPTRGSEDRGGLAGRGGSDGQAMWNDSVAHVVNDETAARGGHRPALITIDSEARRESPRAQDGFVAHNSQLNSSPRSDNHQRIRSTSSTTPVTPSSPALSSSGSRLKKDRRASQGSESASGSPNGSGTPTKKPGFFSKLIHRDKNSKRDSLDGANEGR